MYAAALGEYVARNAPDEVTDTMNRVCEEARDEEDDFLAAAAGAPSVVLNGELFFRRLLGRAAGANGFGAWIS